MNKLINKWFRKIHRWIAVPTALLILIAFIIKMVGNPEVAALWEKWDKLPSVLMLLWQSQVRIYTCSLTLY